MDLRREFLKNKTQVKISINGNIKIIEDIKTFNEKGLESYYHDYSCGQEIHTKYDDQDNIIYQLESPSEQRYWVYEDNLLSSYTSIVATQYHPEVFSLFTEVYEYDENGRKILSLSSDGIKTIISYDNGNKPLNEKTYFPNNTMIERDNFYHHYEDGTYECHTKVIDNLGITSESFYSYDKNGNIDLEIQIGDHRIYRVYDSLGNIICAKYKFDDPEIEDLEYRYVYNEYGLITEEWCDDALVSIYKYYDEDQNANPDHLPYA